jgi:hypothetical protein
MRSAAAWVLLAVIVGAPAVSGAGTCTLSSMRVLVSNYGLDGVLPLQGLALPATVDEAAGTFSLDFSTFPDTSFSIVGVESELSFNATGPTVGTIDADGNVTVPSVPMQFLVHLNETIQVIANPTLTTGLRATTVTGKDYPTEGKPLDFTTGVLTLEGGDVIPDAPNAGGPVSAGLDIVCTLDPKPDQTKLAKGASLGHAGGKGKMGKPLLAGDTTVSPDTLALHMTLKQGAKSVDPATSDVFVRISDATGVEVVLLRIPAGSLMAKGKKLVLKDTDGTNLRVLNGQKSNSQVSAPTTGVVTVTHSKTGLGLKLTETGLDLSKLVAGSATVTLGVGDVAASESVTVKVKGSKVTVK